MKAEEISSGRLFASDQQLQIPLWQRHYSWEGAQLNELWSDIHRLRDESLPSHFLGSIVLKALPWSGTPSEAHRFWVVDGQQRISTLTILVCAIRDRLGQLEPTDDARNAKVQEITAQLLRNTNLKPDHQERLVLQERDQAALDHLIKASSDARSSNLIEAAYAFFRRELAGLDSEETTRLLGTILTRLTAVWVTLEEGDNAHRVFQTLNAGGKKLRQSDLVRNYFFLLLGEAGDDFYANSWRHMENDLTEKELEDYLVAWSISRGYSGGRDSLFSYFHKDLLPFEGDTEEVLNYGKQLTEGSRLFRLIRRPADSTFGDPSIKLALIDLSNWTTLPAEGLIYWLLSSERDCRISSDQLQRGLEATLSFMARRQLAGYEPNLHKSIFVQVTRKLHAANLLDGESVIEFMLYLLSLGEDVRTWPTDEAIRSGVRSQSVYTSKRNQWTFSILERVNRAMFDNPKHAPGPLDRSKFSVEHVMPQTMTLEWVQDLERWGVENPNHLHQSRLNVLGNLTLTVINSELGNFTFDRKRELLKDDWLRLNSEISASKSWTEHSINERSTALGKLACAAYMAPLDETAMKLAQAKFAPLVAGGNVQSDVDSDGDDELDLE